MRAVTCVPSENAGTDGTADSSSSYRLTLSAVPIVPAGAALLSPRLEIKPLRVAEPRCASRGPSLPYDSGDSVTLLRRYTTPPSRRSLEARLAPGLAPGAEGVAVMPPPVVSARL